MVRAVVFPVVAEKTLRELVREAKANEHAFQARVRTVLRTPASPVRKALTAPMSTILAPSTTLGRFSDTRSRSPDHWVSVSPSRRSSAAPQGRVPQRPSR